MSFHEIAESVAAIAASHAAETDRGNFPTAAIEAARPLLGLLSAKEVGGQGESLAAAAAVVERVARACGSTAMVLTMHFAAAAVIEKLGSEEVRKAIAAGKHLSTLAFSEPGSRSMFWVSTNTASDRGVTGKKSFVTSARQADSYVWSTKANGEGLSSLWLVAKGAARADAAFDGLGLRGNDSSPMTAEDAPATRLGADGAGFDTMMGVVLPYFSVMSAAVSCGLMEAAVEKTAAHAGGTKFEHAGTSIAELPTARAFVARMRIRTDQSKLLNADTIAAIIGARADATLRVLETKAAAGEAAAEVTDLAMRVCGGAAFRKDVGVERIFRDARAALIMAPTTDALYDFLGKAVCGLPVF